VSRCKLNKSFSVVGNVGGGGWGEFVSSPMIPRRLPTAMSSLVWVSSFNGGLDSTCCSWNGLVNEDGWGVGDKRRAGWGEEGLLTLEAGWSILSLAERLSEGDSDGYVPRYWWLSPK
jgi:hypothetical protein